MAKVVVKGDLDKAIKIDDYIYYELQAPTYSLHHYIKNDFERTKQWIMGLPSPF